MNEAIAALSKIQNKLNAPKDKAGYKNTYTYRSAEDIMQAVKPLLKEVGAIIILSDDLVLIGQRTYIEATAWFVHDKGEFKAKALAREPERQASMQEPQITGSSSSYARKYALSGLLLIDDNKDPDALEPEPAPQAHLTYCIIIKKHSRRDSNPQSLP